MHYVESLNLLLQKNTVLPTEMKLLKFEELMLHLLDEYPQAVVSFKPTQQNDADDFKIKRVTEANIYENIIIEELAFLCSNSLSTFKRRFSKIYKTSPYKYFLHRKLQQAAVLLVHHGENPSEVFHKVGYENFSSFSNSFKLFYGISHKLYQRHHLSSQPDN